jgi:hypothetical protein
VRRSTCTGLSRGPRAPCQAPNLMQVLCRKAVATSRIAVKHQHINACAAQPNHAGSSGREQYNCLALSLQLMAEPQQGQPQRTNACIILQLWRDLALKLRPDSHHAADTKEPQALCMGARAAGCSPSESRRSAFAAPEHGAVIVVQQSRVTLRKPLFQTQAAPAPNTVTNSFSRNACCQHHHVQIGQLCTGQGQHPAYLTSWNFQSSCFL